MGVERLGRYTILRHLASGGMADVLLGRADGTDSKIAGFERHVVVKRIKAEHAKDKRFIQMFLDEARLATTLHHQNVVQVHDIGEANGEYFFAMEYLHGEDLRKILGTVSRTKSHVPLGNVIAIVAAAAAGLHYAHERRKLDIVHRDVSPSNIIVGYDGSVKVVDFGIAKARLRASDTRTGTLKGKVSYMSPEQCKGIEIDRRSDVYSLGVVLYELATTTRLFKASSDYLVMDAIVQGKVLLPRVQRPDLPNELSSIIMRALAVDPNRRYQTADELRIALEQFAEAAGLTLSTSSLATQMKKLFGEKPEPWLEGVERPSDLAKHSWSDLEPVDDDDDGETSLSDPPTSDHRSSRQSASLPALRAKGSQPPLRAKSSPAISESGKFQSLRRARTTGPQPSAADSISSGIPKKVPSAVELAKPRASSVNDTRTSTRMAWEYQGRAGTAEAAPQMRTRTKVLLLGGPIALALAGIGVWQVLDSKKPVKTPTPTIAPTIAPTITPLPTPPSPAPAPTEVTTTTVPTPAPIAPIAPSRPTQIRPSPSHVEAPPPEPPEPVTTTSSSATTATSTPVVPAPPVVTQAPAPAPVPTPVTPAEPQVTQLSEATVQLVAGDHAAQLAKCENQATLHGDVSITFTINAGGRVVTSQVSSTVHNTKVAACILTAVRSWQFPKPPSGSAKGLYTITYQ